jgi:hypothetical protein
LPALAIAVGGMLALSVPAYAQVATTLEQAELAGLTPAKRAEVQSRLAKGGQTVSEILQTELLNSIKAKMPASRIVALDFGRGIAVVQEHNGRMRAVHFNTSTLAIQS